MDAKSLRNTGYTLMQLIEGWSNADDRDCGFNHPKNTRYRHGNTAAVRQLANLIS